MYSNKIAPITLNAHNYYAHDFKVGGWRKKVKESFANPEITK